MVDFTDLSQVKSLLSDAQDADHDNRIRAREAHHFIDKRDGQWEPSIISNMSNRPRYTFDMTGPVVDQIAGEMEQADFDIRIRPGGGDATKDLALTYDGMIRNIENISGAVDIFNAAGRSMVTGGLDGWRIMQDWADEDSFQQDLFIRPISNFVDRVWFDTGSELQDRSDSMWCFVLQAMSKNDYNEKFPEGSGQSVSDDRTSEVYSHKPDQVVVGEFLYRKPITKELALMSNGAVYEVDDDYKKVKDELAAQGITEEKVRKKKTHMVVTRLFDGADWLTGEQETVFTLIPVIPTYANFKITENKVIYRGAVEKLIDPQRVFNYAKSRQIEEGALAPREKYWGTREQFQGHERTLQTLNTNADPLQTYTHVEGQPAPFKQGGASINPGLQATADDAARSLNVAAGLFSANMGDNAGMQSGVAIELQQNKGDNGTIKYFKSQEVAIRHTARILVKAIPKVYDTKRQVRILNEDGSFEMVTLNDQVFDTDSLSMVTINDLSKGIYDVVCDVGQAFKNRQQETVKAITEIAAIDPTIIAQGADILLNNIASPGIDKLAERKRALMITQGLIPKEQLTDEEKQAQQEQLLIQKQLAANQPPSYEQQLGQAEVEKANAQTADTLSKIQDRENKTAIEAEKLAQNEQQMVLKMMQQQFDNQMATNQAIVDQLNTQAKTLETLRSAMGVDTIIGPHNQQAYIQQSEIVSDTQQQADPALETQALIDTTVQPQ